MNTIRIQYLKTAIGELILGSYNEKLCLLDFRYRKRRKTVDNRIKRGLDAEFVEQPDDLLRITQHQIEEYLQGQRTRFDLPIQPVGSAFQKEVWEKVAEIPYGATSTYLEVAKKVGRASAVRAVASANGANAINLVIPCHRLIGSDGSLVGYGGGITVKKRLLELEKGEASAEK